MGQIVRCPLVGAPCSKPILIEEKTFFLAEAEEPEDVRKRRIKAISEAIADKFKIRSALDEKGINSFTCKICEMIQICAYGIADITDDNPNVLFELGVMIALGKPTIILKRRGQEMRLNLPSDLNAIEIVPFSEYIDIIDPFRKIIVKLPPSSPVPSPIDDIEKIKPQLAKELRKIGTDIVKEFSEILQQAKLDIISLSEEKTDIPVKLSETLSNLEEKLDDMIKLGFPTDVKTAFLRGNYYYNQGKYDDALASYNWCLELRPNDPNTLYNRGSAYYKLERYKESLADFNRFLEIRPDDPDTLYRRGSAYYKLERYKESLADFNRSLELRPDDPGTLNNRGSAYGNLGKYKESLADFNRSLELRLDNPDTLCNRGHTYSKLGKYKEAFADLNRSLELKPDYPAAIYNLACLFSLQSKTNEALDYLEKAIDKDKKSRKEAKTDEDFDNIRGDPRFKKLIESD
jgi:tetratricopeptide (TPR) repeat protein